MIKKKTPLYAVVGNPVAHSKSPVIHQKFAAQFNMPLRYEAIRVEEGAFASFVEEFQSAGGRD